MIARLAAAVVVVVSGAVPASAAAVEPVPEVMAALGDSITSGFNACGFYVSCSSRSWATGDHADVGSHYTRLSRLGGRIRGNAFNFAVPGSTSADLMDQVHRAVTAKADYVTILIGAQDACVRAEKDMTPVEVYRRRMDAALAELRAGLPRARVFVASVPDVRRLWQVGRSNPVARTFWGAARICQTVLADPASVKAADVARRERVRARVLAYNRQAAEACAALGSMCRTDGGAVFSFPFTLRHVSKWDFFHPSAAGQKALAALTFERGFDWADPR